MLKTTFGCFAGFAALLAAPAVLADQRTDAIAAANKALLEEVERFNRESKYTFAPEVDWASVRDFTPDNARSWATKCGGFLTTLRTLCLSDEDGKGIAACSDYVNAKVKTLQCVVTADAADERVELKGTTLVWFMSSGSDSAVREKIPSRLRSLLPGASAIKLQADLDKYLATQDKAKTAKLTVDVSSFAGSELTSLSDMATYCAPAWDVLGMLNHPECQLATCKGDGKKKQAFLEGASQLRCVYSKDVKAPEKKADTLFFYTGKWATKDASLAGIPWAAYNALRVKLKLRDCGVDDRSMDARGQGGVIIREARQVCCPKGKDNQCVASKYEGWEEICKPDGLTAGKTCWKRDKLAKSVLDVAR